MGWLSAVMLTAYRSATASVNVAACGSVIVADGGTIDHRQTIINYHECLPELDLADVSRVVAQETNKMVERIGKQDGLMHEIQNRIESRLRDISKILLELKRQKEDLEKLEEEMRTAADQNFRHMDEIRRAVRGARDSLTAMEHRIRVDIRADNVESAKKELARARDEYRRLNGEFAGLWRAIRQDGARKSIAYVFSGVAGAAVFVVLFSGLAAVVEMNDSDSLCNAGDRCTAEGAKLRRRARNYANIATFSAAISVSALAGAAVIFLVPLTHESPNAAMLSLSGWSVGMTGSF